MRANQANHLLLRIHIFRIPRCRFGLARHVPAFLCTSRLSRLARRATRTCTMPHMHATRHASQRLPNTMHSRCATRAANTPDALSPLALLPGGACAKLTAGPHARNRQTPKHVITISRVHAPVSSHHTLHYTERSPHNPQGFLQRAAYGTPVAASAPVAFDMLHTRHAI
jgi:hypothetical protein